MLLAFLTGRTIFVEWGQNGHFKSKATKSKTQQPSLACQPSGMPVRNQKPRLPSLGGSKREGCRSGLTAGDAVAQSAVDLAEQLLVDGPEDQRAQLDGVDNEP